MNSCPGMVFDKLYGHLQRDTLAEVWSTVPRGLSCALGHGRPDSARPARWPSGPGPGPVALMLCAAPF